MSTHNRLAMPYSKTEKIALKDLSSSVLSTLKKGHLYGNLKFNNLGVVQSLKLHIFLEKSFQFLLS